MKIACDNCNGTIAHVYGDRTIELVRQGHKITVLGGDFTVMASCPNTGKCNNKVALVVENGKLILDNLKQKEDNNDEEEDKNDKDENGDDNPGDKDDNPDDNPGDKDDKGDKGDGDDKDDKDDKPPARKYTKV